MSTEKTAQVDPCKVITGRVRFSFVNVFEPKENEDGKKQYQVSIIIDPEDDDAAETLRKVNAAIEAAKQKGKSKKFEGKIPAKLKLPLGKGSEDRPDNPEYAGKFFLNANAPADKPRPGVVDAKRLPITDPELLYSGCYGRASISFYPFNFEGKKGIGCGLNNIQKLEDGERLAGSRASAEDDFNDGVGGDDDFL